MHDSHDWPGWAMGGCQVFDRWLGSWVVILRLKAGALAQDGIESTQVDVVCPRAAI